MIESVISPRFITWTFTLPELPALISIVFGSEFINHERKLIEGKAMANYMVANFATAVVDLISKFNI